MRRAVSLVCLILLFFVWVSDVPADQKLKLLVVPLIEAHPDHVLLRNTFMDALKEKGYELDVTIFDANSAEFPEKYTQRAAAKAKEMESAGAQMIYTTGVAHAMVGKVNIPIIDGVFIAPVLQGQAEKRDGKIYSKYNATGTLFGYSFKDIVRFARDAKPKAKKIAYVWSSASPISRPIAEIEEEATKLGFEVVDCSFTKTKEEALLAIEKATREADIAFATNDIAVFGVETHVLDFAATKNFPVIVAIVPLVDAGAIAGIQWDWAVAGKICAVKADQVLKGKAANEIPIETAGAVEIGINAEVAQKLGIEIPFTWLESATKILE